MIWSELQVFLIKVSMKRGYIFFTIKILYVHTFRNTHFTHLKHERMNHLVLDIPSEVVEIWLVFNLFCF